MSQENVSKEGDTKQSLRKSSQKGARQSKRTSIGSTGSKCSGSRLNVSQDSKCSLGISEEYAGEEGEMLDMIEMEEISDTFYGSLREPNVKPTYSDYERLMLQQSDLFSKILTTDSDGNVVEQKKKEELADILISGFGIRNLKSLQDALALVDERKRLKELYAKQQAFDISEEGDSILSPISSSLVTSTTKRSTSTSTETDKTAGKTLAQRQLEYLMGLKGLGEGEEFIPKTVTEVTEEDYFKFSTSISTKQAQEYLRLHRIFDFFQYIIAQLLGSHSDNPIIFILELLNKCLCYRAGQGQPPLLYEKIHIAQLFKMMDRMGEGVIEMKQYHQGMKTLGICEYNKIPKVNKDGNIERDVFIKEVHEAEVLLFDDLIKVKSPFGPPRRLTVFSKKGTLSDGVSIVSSGPYFMPSDLFRSIKAKPKTDKVVVGEG